MPNSIPTLQNDDRQLERLAAQRRLYSDAKGIQIWHTIVSVPVVVVWSFAVLVRPEWKVYAALWGIGLTFLDMFVLSLWQNRIKNTAAKIQELFDCDVLDLPWHNLKLGRRPDAETIMAAANRYRKENPQFVGLRDWYPVDAGTLPLHIGRVICQRANCWWDAQLRRRYSIFLLVGVGAVSALVLFFSAYGEFTLERFILTGLVPLMPVLTLGLRRFRDQREAADRADRLKEAAEDLWTLALVKTSTEEQITYGSRQLQDEIYEHRRRSPVHSNWLYNRMKQTHEEQMNKGAKVLVDEAVAKLRWEKESL